MTRTPTPEGVLLLPRSASRDQWLAARRGGITATDVVRIVGLSTFGNALDVYVDKRVGAQGSEREDAAWGQALEDVVAREWAARGGHLIRRVGLLANANAAHHLASCDRLVISPRQAAEGVLEVKTTSARSGPWWDDAPPERVVVQVQWQLHVTGLEVAHVAALIGGQELRGFTVDRDQVMIDYLIGEADRVWAAVQVGTPPDIPGWQATAAALDRLHPDRAGTVDVDPAAAGPLLAAYRAAAAAEHAAAEWKEQARVGLIGLLGDADTAMVDGRTAWTYRAGKPRLTIPADRARRLLADHPDLAAVYAVERTTRRFTLAKEEES